MAFAGIGDVDNGSFGGADPEDHGVATQRITGGQWFLDYSHNGTTGIGSTDVFEFTDGDGNGENFGAKLKPASMIWPIKNSLIVPSR